LDLVGTKLSVLGEARKYVLLKNPNNPAELLTGIRHDLIALLVSNQLGVSKHLD
jgi:hypothetical protein